MLHDLPSRWQIDRKAGLFAIAFMTALLVCNIALLRQNQVLKKEVSVRTQPARLNQGDQLPPLHGLNLIGEKFVIEYAKDSPKTILLVFSPHCGWCKRNMPNWRTMLSQVDRSKYRFIGLSTSPESVEEYVTVQEMTNIPVI